jgi:hypothetical protein
MRPKPHHRLFLVVVLGSVAFGVGCDRLRARDKLNKGVQAFKGQEYDLAIEDFKQARQLDPSLTNAQLYLATAYASQYVPGAPSPENLRLGQQAVKEFQDVLDKDPNNLSAIDGIGSILYNMAGTPYDAKKMEEAKTYHERHIQTSPNDADPYYWVGVIDWAIAFRGNRDLREDYNKTARKRITDPDPMPPALATQFMQKYGSIVDEGMTSLEKAISIRSDYDDAMAYLNLLYRQKADMETSAAARNADEDQANDLVDKVKAIKQKRESAAASQ